MSSQSGCDVAIIGGGPAGASCAALLRKYSPNLKVVIFERERFPRDHVGESLLPVACRVLHNMGCWDRVEAAGFPVKIGATYRWGSSKDLWDFDFLGGQPYEDVSRPAKYEGQRRNTAFQVDRSRFDDLLLRHAEDLGVDVKQNTKVAEVCCKGSRVEKFVLEDGSDVYSRYFVDASGHAGLLRRAVGVDVIEPSALKNIAIWRYWNNAHWAVTIGASGTRVQVLSLGWGWIWVIPITSTRTSIGLVLPAEYYRKSGLRPSELYDEAMRAEPNLQAMLAGAVAEEQALTTKDWSFLASRMADENWFLVGESAGFADPILAAGISLAMVGAQEAAITIAELERGVHDPSWLKSEFEKSQTRRIRAHIQFADYWYTANAHFTDLVEFTGEIANQAGMQLKGKDAWQWLGTGGFIQMGGAGIAGFSLASTKWLVNTFDDGVPDWLIAHYNIFTLNLEGADRVDVAIYHEGGVEKAPAISRGNKMLPARGIYRFWVQALTQTNRLDNLLSLVRRDWCGRPEAGQNGLRTAIEALEGMVNDGWVTGSYTQDMGLLNVEELTGSELFHRNVDNEIKF